MLKQARNAAVYAMMGVLFGGAALAQQTEQLRERVNSGTVTVVGGGVDDTLMMSELAEELNLPGAIRILPITGEGGVQNIADILYLRGTDMAIVESDVLELIRKRNLYPNLERRVSVIAKLYIEEVHLLAHRSVRSFSDLAGKKVNFGIQGTGSYERSQQIFRSLGVAPTPLGLETREALAKVTSGEIAAMVYVAPKPSSFIQQASLGKDVHLLSIPFAGELTRSYVPASIGKADYPNLVSRDEAVKTLGVSAVLAVYNWDKPNDRSKKVDNFVATFFDNIQRMHGPQYHPKWREVSLSAELPGWQRLKVAQVWLSKEAAANRARQGQLLSGANQEGLRKEFRAFLSSLEKSRNLQPVAAAPQQAPAEGGAKKALSDDSLKALFTNFLEWRRQQTE